MAITFNSKANINDEAVRYARLARTLLTWDDARAALALAIEMLNEWEKIQPHPHSSIKSEPIKSALSEDNQRKLNFETLSFRF